MITDSVASIVRLYNKDFKYYDNFQKIRPEQIYTYDFQECSCATFDQINTYFSTPRFFKKLEFMSGADVAIESLCMLFDVYVVTLGTPANLRMKKDWLTNKLKLPLKFIGIDINVCDDKSMLDMSDGILIDDNISYLRSSNAKYKIIFGEEHSWNIDYEGEYPRCVDWNDAFKKITQIMEECE